MAFQQVLGRVPDAEETAQVLDYFENRPISSAVEQMLWALMASSEFRLNR